MAKNSSFNVVYDAGADVLYIIKKDVPAARGVEDRFGIVWRYDGDGDLIGATVVDFYDQWFSERPLLADKIAQNFHIPTKQAKVVVDHAMEEATP